MLPVYLTMCWGGIPVKTGQIPAIRDILYLRLRKVLAQGMFFAGNACKPASLLYVIENFFFNLQPRITKKFKRNSVSSF